MPQVFGGSQNVNPEFSTPNDIIDRLVWYRAEGHNTPTVGIARNSVVANAGLLWTGTAGGETKRYLPPEQKGNGRGWQANFQIRNGANALIYNGHVSVSRFD